jgi:hypothetical protein
MARRSRQIMTNSKGGERVKAAARRTALTQMG